MLILSPSKESLRLSLSADAEFTPRQAVCWADGEILYICSRIFDSKRCMKL